MGLNTVEWLKKFSSNKPPLRLPVPGPVWGYYPERKESAQADSLSRAGDLDIKLIEKNAVQSFAVNPQPVTPETGTLLRKRLLVHGYSEPVIAQIAGIAGRAIYQALDLKPHACQYQTAAIILNQGLAEMATGEGKSIAAAIAAMVSALNGAPVHLITSNDYLAGRDAKLFARAFDSLGITCAYVDCEMSEEQRKAAYQADICYGTAKTIAFDYLRDSRRQNDAKNSDDLKPALMLRGLCVAIIDEADSILLDEATMPLVLAENDSDPASRARLWQAIDLARQLKTPEDFTADPVNRHISFSESGYSRIAQLATNYSNDWINKRYRQELIREALLALHVFKRDIDYIVSDEQIVLVDANTGRAAPGRQLPGMLHGLIAIRENLDPPPATRSASGLTYPRFFARYHQLSGLSGTLVEAKRELRTTYGLDVTVVARHHPNLVQDLGKQVFSSSHQRFEAAVHRACQMASQGRSVLLGCDSVIESEFLAKLFGLRNVAVTILNAQSDEQEAELIRQSGQSGKITVTTQIAGRGTDIRPDPETVRAGGLHVLNLQHNRNERIDRQLNGRAARQGDPGSFEQWVCLHESPLDTGNLPSAIRFIPTVLNRVQANQLSVAFTQWYWHLEDRLSRSARLRADRQSSENLQFSSMNDQ